MDPNNRMTSGYAQQVGSKRHGMIITPAHSGEWQTPTTAHFEPQLQTSKQESQHISSFNRQVSESNLATPVDSLGIRYWPPTSNPATSRPPTSRPKTIHEGAYPTELSADFLRPSWNPYGSRIPPSYPLLHQGGITSEELLTFNSIDSALIDQKPSDENLDLQHFDSDFTPYSSDVVPQDENTPIINLRRCPTTLDEPLSLDTNFSRRLSGSSFSMSSTGGPVDIPDFSAFSEVPSYTSDYTPRSSLNLSVTPLSPIPASRCSQPDVVRTGSRSRASPSPRASMRTAPYTLDGGRNKRWSTGSYGSSPARRSSPFVYSANDGYFPPVPNLSRVNSPLVSNNKNLLPSSNLSNLSQMVNPNGPLPRFHRNSMLLPSTFDALQTFDNPPPLPSHGLFRTLQSNADPHDHHLDHYADLTDPPDLFGPLSEEQLPPPDEDMTPDDSDLVPHEQELRFQNDLYTPKWVRGHGNKREGWCGICKPGRWLVLKNSAFWYDKSFTHGISAATGQAFEGPKETRRMDGNLDVWEGLCGSCGEWIALVSSKKKGTTWFRHAYKCHTHPKIKDAPKRRRESGHARPSTANSITKPKADPVTPAMSTTSLAGDGLGPGPKTISPLQSISSMI